MRVFVIAAKLPQVPTILMSKQDPQILDVQQYSDQTTFLKTLQETTEDCRVESPMRETNREDFAGDFFSSGTGQTNLIFPVQ